jgi:acid phosphatase
VRVLALGDMGTGTRFQRAVALQMCAHHDAEPVDAVLTTGDNVYPSGEPELFDERFVEPYSCLLDDGVEFHASLGNHDVVTDRGRAMSAHPAFGMSGRYYRVRLGPLEVVVLDSNDLDAAQLAWLGRALRRARDAPWTVVVFHHPVYSHGLRHGSTPGFADLLGARFSRAGVDLVLNGHEHLYERVRAQGVTYVVTGGGGAQLDLCRRPLPARVRACLTALHFVELEATRSRLVLRALNHQGELLDRARVRRNP